MSGTVRRSGGWWRAAGVVCLPWLLTLPVGCLQAQAPQPQAKMAAKTAGPAEATMGGQANLAEPELTMEQRVQHLAAYLRRHRSPLAKDAPMFVTIAAEYGLDWRLLPSIAMMETGCGRYTGSRPTNIMGWGREQFASIEAGVRHVASRLAAGPAYRGKSTEEKLKTYNKVRRSYASEVFAHMRRIAPFGLGGE